MKKPDFRSLLANRLSDFVRLKRLGGVDPANQIELLRYFDRFLAQERFRGAGPTPELIERYLIGIKHLDPGTRDNRLSVVRQFCRYLRLFDPACYIPEPLLRRGQKPSRLPHLYADTEIRALIQAARELPPAGSLRPETYHTLFGLLKDRKNKRCFTRKSVKA